MRLLLFLCFFQMTFSDNWNCRINPDCGMYKTEPYSVTYDFEQESPAYEKAYLQEEGPVMIRKLEPGEQYRLASFSYEPQNIQFRFQEKLPMSSQPYQYSFRVEDETGNQYSLKLEWAAYYVSKKTILFMKRRKYYHYVKVTLGNKVITFFNEPVEHGMAHYGDFFSVGKVRYRLDFDMVTELNDYIINAELAVLPSL